MKKIILIVAVVVVVGIVAALAVGYSQLNRIVKSTVEQVGPRVTGTSVTLADIDISPFGGTMTLDGLSIGNPDGFQTESAFSLGSVEMAMDVRSITKDTIVIHKLTVHAPEVTYEMGMGGSNIAKIQESIEAWAPASEPADPAAKQKRVIIEEFVVTGGKVRLSASMLGGKAATLPMPAVTLTDIGKEGDGATWKEAIDQMYGVVFGAVRQVVQSSTDMLKGMSGKTLEGVSGAVSESTDRLKGEADKALGGLSDMFGGSKEEAE